MLVLQLFKYQFTTNNEYVVIDKPYGEYFKGETLQVVLDKMKILNL